MSELKPERLLLSPQQNFRLGPQASLAVNDKGQVGFAGAGLVWARMRFIAPCGQEVPLALDKESGRPYYEAHWPAVRTMESGKPAARKAVSSLVAMIEKGAGSWMGPPTDQGRTIPLAFHLLDNAFQARISDADLIRALARPTYCDLKEHNDTLLDRALELRLFKVADALEAVGFVSSPENLSTGEAISALVLPRTRGEGSNLSAVMARLIGARPVQSKNKASDRDFESQEANWISRGACALTEHTARWLDKLHAAGTSWRACLHLTVTSAEDDTREEMTLLWPAVVHRFLLRDYGKTAKPMRVDDMDQRAWQQMWEEQMARVPTAVLREENCVYRGRHITAIQMLRQSGQIGLASTLEQRTLDDTTEHAATQRKTQRL